jgi:hypothetical protein
LRLSVHEIEKLHREIGGDSELRPGAHEFTIADCNGMRLTFVDGN